MDCPVYLGAMRILLEDLGFTFREEFDEQRHMSYCCFTAGYFDKLFADINRHYTIEMFLDPAEIHLDRWQWDVTSKLYLVISELELNLYDPSSIPQIVDFVEETISIA